jgi:alpha-glucosidase
MEEINRKSIRLRYHLLPYIYTAFWETSETGVPIMRPLLLEYPDDWAAVDRNDEYLFGNDLLVAPVTKDYDDSRRVYLPRGLWYDFWTDHHVTGPREIDVDAPLERIPLFVRGGAIIPSQQDVQYTGEAPIDPLTFDVYPDGTSSRAYYEDDGISFNYQHGAWLRQRLTATQDSHGVGVQISAREGSFTPPKRSMVIKIHAQRVRPREVTLTGGQLPVRDSLKSLAGSVEGWLYDDEAGVVWIRLPDRGAAVNVQVAQ